MGAVLAAGAALGFALAFVAVLLAEGLVVDALVLVLAVGVFVLSVLDNISAPNSD